TKVDVESTITVPSPEWTPRGNPDAASVEAWNAYLAAFEKNADEEANLCRRSVDDFVDGAMALSGPSEAKLREDTDALFVQMKTDAENRLKGFRRRQSTKSRVVIHPKKKP